MTAGTDPSATVPLAAGTLPLPRAIILAFGLIAVGSGIAFTLSVTAGLCVLLYLMLTLTYSLWLKRMIFLDVLSLSILYALRVFSGAGSGRDCALALVSLVHDRNFPDVGHCKAPNRAERRSRV